MNKNTLLALSFLLIGTGGTQAQTANWKPVGDKIKTQWAAKVDPAKPLPEYPRPQICLLYKSRCV